MMHTNIRTTRGREWVVAWHLVPQRRAVRLRRWLKQRVEKDMSPYDMLEPLKGVNSIGDLWLALTLIGALAVIILAAPVLLLAIEILLVALAIVSAVVSLLFLRRPIRITATSGHYTHTWQARSIIASLLLRHRIIAQLEKDVSPKKIR